MRTISIALMSLFIAVSAWSDVIVSVTGTADSTGMGYDVGESYTFNWTINDGYDGCDGDFFDSTMNQWHTEETAHPKLLSDVSGDGLSGTYSRPSGSSNSPYARFEASSSGLRLLAGNDVPSSGSMGLTVNGVDLQYLFVDNLTASGLDLDYSDSSFVNPATWADDYIGTYASEVSESRFYVRDKNNNITDFTATRFEIGFETVVPEPSSLAMLAVICALGLFNRRRFLA